MKRSKSESRGVARGRWRAAAVAALAGISVGGPSAEAQDVLRGHGGPVRALALAPTARELVSGSFDSTLIVWDLERSAAKRVLRFHDGAVNAVVALSDGCFASGGEDNRIAVWCGNGERPAHVLTAHEAKITALAALDRGRMLASASFDRTVRMWSLPAGSPSRVVAQHRAPVTSLAVGADGREVVSADMEGMVRATRIAEEAGQELAKLGTPVTAAIVAADGEVVLAGADGKLRLAREGAAPHEIEIAPIPLASLVLSPDGRLIATAGLRGGIAIVERASRRILHRLTGPGLPVWSLAFDSDGRTLISGGADRVIRRWDAVAGKALTSNVPERDVVAEAVASGERGAQVFRACQACHTLSPDDGNRAGPTLFGIFGRRIGTSKGYAYSEALRRMEIVWSKETIARLFEVGPAAYTPGTKMPEQTITDPTDRRALVEWLERVTSR
jgi:cytochrome c